MKPFAAYLRVRIRSRRTAHKLRAIVDGRELVAVVRGGSERGSMHPIRDAHGAIAEFGTAREALAAAHAVRNRDPVYEPGAVDARTFRAPVRVLRDDLSRVRLDRACTTADLVDALVGLMLEDAVIAEHEAVQSKHEHPGLAKRKLDRAAALRFDAGELANVRKGLAS